MTSPARPSEQAEQATEQRSSLPQRSEPGDGGEEAEQRVEAASDPESDSPSDDEEASRPAVGPEIRTSAGITYDVRQLNSRTRRRAEAGVNGHFEIQRCTEVSPQQHYDFEFDKLVHVRVFKDHDRQPECNCRAYAPSIACKHIFHIGHEVVLSVGNVTEPLTLQSGGGSVQGIPLSDLINRKTIRSIAEARTWGFRQLSSSIVRQDGPGTLRARTENLQEMLSVYEPNDALPEEFRDEIQRASTPPGRRELSQTYRRASDVLINLALADDDLYTGLRDILNPTVCARVYYNKIVNRVDEALKRLDEDAARSSAERPGERTFTVDQCALAITEYMADIKANETRNRVGPEAANLFAATLLDILARVVARNRDVYTHAPRRTRPAGEPEADRNLYARMVGAAAQADRLDVVVAECLRGLGRDIVRNHEDRLAGIRADIREHDAGLAAPGGSKRARAGTTGGGSSAAGTSKRRAGGRR